MVAVEREIEESARANRDFVSMEGVNFYDELKENVSEGQSEKEKRETAAKNMSLKLM